MHKQARSTARNNLSTSSHLACVAGVNGEGEGEREKNGVLRARDEGTPATKTPIFSSPSTNFYVIQLS